MTEPRWLDEDEFAAWSGFLEASNRLMRLVEHQLRTDSGLSHPQYEILVRLADAPDGEMRMSDLAESMVTSKSGLTYQVKQLVKAGLVRRRTCPSDVRRVYAVLTDAGQAALRAAAPGHVATVRAHLIDLLGADELAAMATALATVNAALRERDLRPSG